jgi:hypothetical protein
MKKILSVTLLAVALWSVASAAVVGHNGKYFHVTESDKSYKVGRESIDSTLKNINKANLAMFMKKGRISARKTSDGSYVLRGHVNGLGGGPTGAMIGSYLGKFTVHFLGHGAMLIAAACTGPAAPATFAALEATFIGPLEAASNVGAVGGMIIGAVATGPV